MLSILAERRFPVATLRAFASPSSASAGKTVSFRGKSIPVEPLVSGCFRGVDLALFSAGASISREWCPRAVEEGAIAVDNSSAFRADPKVPLVIPEVNPESMRGGGRLFAVPNCSTIVLLMALKPLHEAAGIKRILVSTYQAVSGAGARAMQQLEAEIRLWARAAEMAEPSRAPVAIRARQGRVTSRGIVGTLSPRAQAALKARAGTNGTKEHGAAPVVGPLPHPIAFNVIPQVGNFLPDGFSQEEMKFVHESRRILGIPALKIVATTVRVPVWRCHAESVYAEFSRPLTPAKARQVLAKAPGVRVFDEPEAGRYPMPILAAGGDETWVGRLRADPTVKHGLCFWVVGDQLRKGAALNAIQIAECVLGLARSGRAH